MTNYSEIPKIRKKIHWQFYSFTKNYPMEKTITMTYFIVVFSTKIEVLDKHTKCECRLQHLVNQVCKFYLPIFLLFLPVSISGGSIPIWRWQKVDRIYFGVYTESILCTWKNILFSLYFIFEKRISS